MKICIVVRSLILSVVITGSLLGQDLGIKHFIIGDPKNGHNPIIALEPITQLPISQLPLSTAKKFEIYFAPDQDLGAKLIDFIHREQKKIKAAVFLLTDERIAMALIDAHKRGVKIELVVDPKHVHDRYSKVELLRKESILVYLYNPKYAHLKGSSLMHHKFAVFSDVVWAGSFNWTDSGSHKNQESIIVLNDAQAVKEYSEQFECLKRRCTKSVSVFS